jgi:hypothetical protein
MEGHLGVSKELGFRCQVSGVSMALSGLSGQSDQNKPLWNLTIINMWVEQQMA